MFSRCIILQLVDLICTLIIQQGQIFFERIDILIHIFDFIIMKIFEELSHFIFEISGNINILKLQHYMFYECFLFCRTHTYSVLGVKQLYHHM